MEYYLHGIQLFNTYNSTRVDKPCHDPGPLIPWRRLNLTFFSDKPADEQPKSPPKQDEDNERKHETDADVHVAGEDHVVDGLLIFCCYFGLDCK